MLRTTGYRALVTIGAALGLGAASLASPAAHAESVLRIAMTAADLPDWRGQPDQGFEGAVHDLARGRPVDSGDQADTAGVVVCG